MAEKGRSTQELVNSYPEWSNVRTDEQSLGYQIFNQVGLVMDDLRKQLENVNDNYFLPTSIVSDIDLYYRIRLDDSYEFEKDDNDDTDFIFTPPTVSGVALDGNRYNVTISENNDIETFWYTATPDRLSLEDMVTDDHFIASGFAYESPLNPIASSGLWIPNRLTLKLEDGTSFVGIENNGFIRRTFAQVEGKNREGVSLTEEVYFLHNDTEQTIHEFSEIAESGIRIYGVKDPAEAKLTVNAASFNQADYPIGYELDTTKEKREIPLYWSIGTTASGLNTLDLVKYDIDEIELRVDGFTTKHEFLQQELLNELGTNIVPLDLAPEPHSDRIWIVDSQNLYVYDNALPYPNLSLLAGKNYQSNSVIEPSSYYTVLNEEIEVNYLWRRPITGFVAHRVWLTKPDGTTVSLENGEETTYHTDSTSWIFGEPQKRKIRESEFYTLNQRGDYIFSMECRYTDETQQVDKRVVSVVYKEPLKQYSLTSLGLSNIQGVDFDSEYNLWVLDNSGVKYKIAKHYDNMLIDFTRKIIYFREPYLKVQVK